jgi:signal transduction histidine kinase
VLLNLLDNALKYGRDNSTVRVALEQRDGLLQLSVADQGSGVAREERERIWQAFERGKAAENRVTGGSGIGLTVVSEIAHAHGGKTWIEDAPGGGARFVVTFAGGSA